MLETVDVVDFIGDISIPLIVDIQAAAISPDTPKLLFSRREAAYSLGLSLRSICTLLKNRKLKYRKVGVKTLIPHQELVKFSKSDHDLT